MMLCKLGLRDTNALPSLITNLTTLMEKTSIDMTIFFRELSNFVSKDFSEFWKIILKSSYLKDEGIQQLELKKHWETWMNTFCSAIVKENWDSTERLNSMKLTNPKYVLRNYMAQMAIEEAEKGNYKVIDELYHLLLNPYSEQVEMEKWYAKRPQWAENKIGCSMLSCSS